MKELVALKKLRYPRGPDGKEYDIGDPFTVFSERDATALTLVRAAKEAPAKETKSKTARAFESQSPQPSLALSDKEMKPEDAGEGDTPQSSRRRYQRRDMKAED